MGKAARPQASGCELRQSFRSLDATPFAAFALVQADSRCRLLTLMYPYLSQKRMAENVRHIRHCRNAPAKAARHVLGRDLEHRRRQYERLAAQVSLRGQR